MVALRERRPRGPPPHSLESRHPANSICPLHALHSRHHQPPLVAPACAETPPCPPHVPTPLSRSPPARAARTGRRPVEQARHHPSAETLLRTPRTAKAPL